jgi:transcriptional regulator with XRE-family HTH domain
MKIEKVLFVFEEEDKWRFKEFLVKNKKTLRSFAKELNVSVAYVSDIIRGNRYVSKSVIELFKKAGFDIKAIYDFSNIKINDII